MDRNTLVRLSNPFDFVALRKESVDRNACDIPASQNKHKSLSARRAWIEILAKLRVSRAYLVALRKESVDRNISLIDHVITPLVALRKESVDRNSIPMKSLFVLIRRSPQGERG